MILGVYIIIIYVSYSFTKNHFESMWPLLLLRTTVSFIVTVLFFPLLGKEMI